MPAGRPTDYSEEMLRKSRDYLDNFKEVHGHIIPSVVGLAKVLGKHADTLYEWAKHEDKKEFSDILRRINNNQHFELLHGGLSGELNSNITKLVLGKHGYHDKQDQTIAPGNGVKEAKWSVEFVNASEDVSASSEG